MKMNPSSVVSIDAFCKSNASFWSDAAAYHSFNLSADEDKVARNQSVETQARSQFGSLKFAKEAEARALAGDEEAMMKMHRFWNSEITLKVPSYDWDRPVTFPLYKDNATPYLQAAVNASYPAALDFVTAVKLGSKTPFDNMGGHKYQSEMRSKAITAGRSNFPQLVEQTKQAFSKALPNLEECAKSGSGDAAHEMARIYRNRDWTFPGYKNRNIANPYFDLAKADYWNNVGDVLLGLKQDQNLMNSFIFSQDDTTAGLYNIAHAFHENNLIRRAYNRREGRPDNDKSAVMDFLIHASNNGSANAAWRAGMIWQAKTDEADHLAKAAQWYKRAEELGHPNAKHKLDYIARNHPSELARATDPAAIANPSQEHLKRYPGSAGLVAVSNYDYSFISDPSQGKLEERLARAAAMSDKQVAEFDGIVAGLQHKIEMIMRERARKNAAHGEAESTIASGFRHNTETARKIGEQERQLLSDERWIKQESAKIAAGVAMTVITTMAGAPAGTGAISIARTFGEIPSVRNERQLKEDIIAGLTASMQDIPFLRAHQKELERDMERLSKSVAVATLQKDQSAVQRLLQGYLRRQMIEVALQNCEIVNRHLSKTAIGSVDSMLAGFEQEAKSGDAVKVRTNEAVHNFFMGYADSNDLNVLIAHSDRVNTQDVKTPAHETGLHRFVERQIKPSIGDYISKASRMDVLRSSAEDIIPKLGKSVSQAAPDILAQGNRELATLARADFASEGSLAVNRVFDFYLHRHGKTVLHDTRLNDGIVSNATTPKVVTLWTGDQKDEFIERTVHSYKHGNPQLPTVDNLFLRVCAAEYFEPQSVLTSGQAGTFKDNPQAPAAYPMANDVIANFIERMSLSPIGTYRKVMEDKKPLDALVAQSFIDFFAQLGVEHNAKFADDRKAMAKSYDLKNYGSRFHDACARLTDDALERYDLFKEIFAQNLQKTLDISTREDGSRLVSMLNDVKAMGAKGLDPENLVMPGTPEALERAIRGKHRFENMHPPTGDKSRG